ncbi:PREDICTED: uncharacterized protein LOC109327716 [Lupinus angustifolius]|uniref:uncharacterized protein LOC109327716 n=1 Tax=Lupinus angustifolius TaxID=3871 RepID=UPI00092E8DEB|nr:PREDICTED: uncharacterized protein LOC109327716 [Lupinus angustifolius]
MWIFRHKKKSNGSFERYKARLVGDSRSQIADYVCRLKKSLYALKQAPGTNTLMIISPPLVFGIAHLTIHSSSIDVVMTWPTFCFVRHKGGLFLNQNTYASEIIAWAGMASCKPSTTLVDTK